MAEEASRGKPEARSHAHGYLTSRGSQPAAGGPRMGTATLLPAEHCSGGSGFTCISATDKPPPD